MLKPCGALRRILEGTRQIRAKNKKRACIFSDTSGHPDWFFSDRKKEGWPQLLFHDNIWQPEVGSIVLNVVRMVTATQQVGMFTHVSDSDTSAAI
jgi:hypothetical protein